MKAGDLVLVPPAGHHGKPCLAGIVLDEVFHPQAEITFYMVLVGDKKSWHRSDTVVLLEESP